MRCEGSEGYIAVVGAVNVDICGASRKKLLYGDSNPGSVTISLGGVGRNIAWDIMMLGFDVKLIAAIGDDALSLRVRDGCRESGIDISHSLTVAGGRTSTYLCVNDCDGDVAAAVNDMAIYDELTPEFLETKLDALNGAKLIIIDANIPLESVEFIVRNCRPPIAADPVSVRKAGKLKHSLGRFAFIKPNRPEAALLTGVDIRSNDDLPKAAEAFFRAGLKRVIISLGAEGVYYNDGEESGILPCRKSEIIDTTGCGDAFVAGAAAGFTRGLKLRDMAKMGLACASVCATSRGAVSTKLCMDAVNKIIDGPWKEQ